MTFPRTVDPDLAHDTIRNKVGFADEKSSIDELWTKHSRLLKIGVLDSGAVSLLTGPTGLIVRAGDGFRSSDSLTFSIATGETVSAFRAWDAVFTKIRGSPKWLRTEVITEVLLTFVEMVFEAVKIVSPFSKA